MTQKKYLPLLRGMAIGLLIAFVITIIRHDTFWDVQLLGALLGSLTGFGLFVLLIWRLFIRSDNNEEK